MSKLPAFLYRNWYVWGIAAYPVLFLYARNLETAGLRYVLIGFLVNAAVAGCSFGILYRRSKDRYHASVVTALVMLCFVSYGSLYQLSALSSGVLGFLRYLWLILMILMVFGVGKLLRGKTAALERLTPYLNGIVIILLLMGLNPLWVPLLNVAKHPGTRITTAASCTDPALPADPAMLPDIYYIITDAYPRADVLLERNNFDNSSFVADLEGRGFYVAAKSAANYPLTKLSFPSSLNMQYWDELAEVREQTIGLRHVTPLVPDSLVAKELMCQGYSYVYLAQDVFSASELAIGNAALGQQGRGQTSLQSRDFLSLVLDSTLLIHRNLLYQPSNWRSPEYFLEKVDLLAQISAMPEVTFTFAHLMKPHEPYVFDRDGNIVMDYTEDSAHYANSPESAHRVTDQIEYLNTVLLETVDTIIANASVPPIIIIQADHGLAFGGYENPYVESSSLLVAYPFEILNAYYLPGGGDAFLYPDISPVNSFRLVLDYYFGTNYGLLPDRHFNVPRGYQEPFLFEDVTDDFH